MIRWTGGQKLCSDSMCVPFMDYIVHAAASNWLILFTYSCFSRKAWKSHPRHSALDSLWLYIFLNGVCPYALLLLSCEGLASHVDVLRLVTRSSPRTSAQQTGHLAFVLGYSKPSRCPPEKKKFETSSFACCFYWNPYKLHISRKDIKIMFCFDFCFPKEAEAVRRR